MIEIEIGRRIFMVFKSTEMQQTETVYCLLLFLFVLAVFMRSHGPDRLGGIIKLLSGCLAAPVDCQRLFNFQVVGLFRYTNG